MQGHGIAQMRPHFVSRARGICEQLSGPVTHQDGDGQRHRRIRQVVAADIEEPGDRFAGCQYCCRDPVLLQDRRKSAAFVCTRFARISDRVRANAPGRQRRAVSPVLINGIGVRGYQSPARPFDGLSHLLGAADAEQSWIKADGCVLSYRIHKPAARGASATVENFVTA